MRLEEASSVTGHRARDYMKQLETTWEWAKKVNWLNMSVSKCTTARGSASMDEPRINQCPFSADDRMNVFPFLL
jgi:hypothetical protein